jgi:transcriptional regulator GlxA family with amidase domain
MASGVRRVWLCAFPGSELLDLTGPWEVLGHTNDMLGRVAYELAFVSPSGGGLLTRHGLALAGALSLQRAARRGLPHTLVVAGGMPLSPMPAPEARLARWLRAHHRGIPRVVSICTGSFVLAESGLLDGKPATTHWRFLDLLRRRYPRVSVADDAIFTCSGRTWTSAGITAGIDLMLALVERDQGHALAMAVARQLLLFLRRSGKQAQFSEALRRQHHERPRLRDLCAYIVENVDAELSVDALARRVGTSPRSLSRWCREELAESPASLVRRIRLDEVRRLLAETELPLKAIAARTGVGDASTLWRVFTKALGVTPAVYRERFSPSAAGRGSSARRSA